MKTKVNRSLQAGMYYVNFSFSDFSPEELDKMQAFGVPSIRMQWGKPPVRNSGNVPINQIGPNFNPSFTSEEEAKAYEQDVLDQVRTAMEALRKRKDDFSSSNVGRGSATNLTITAQYTVHDAGNSTKRYTVNRDAVVQLLEPNESVALLICHIRILTAGDFATLVTASMRASDFYSDALREPPLTISVLPQTHRCEPEPDCTVRLA